MFTSEKSPNRRGPRQFKPVSLQGQLHSSPDTLVKVVFVCSVNIRGDAEVKGITSFPLDKALSPPFPRPLRPHGPSDHCPVRGGTESGSRSLPPLSCQGSKSAKGNIGAGMGAHLLHIHTEIALRPEGETCSLPQGADSPEQA